MAGDLTARLNDWASPEEVAGVAAALQEAGIDADVDATWQRKPGTGNGPSWIVELVLNHPLNAFLTGFFGAGGVAAFQAMVNKIRDVRRASGIESGSIPIYGEDGRNVSVAPTLFPDRAYSELLETDWSQVAPGFYVWTEEDGWHDPMKG